MTAAPTPAACVVAPWLHSCYARDRNAKNDGEDAAMDRLRLGRAVGWITLSAALLTTTACQTTTAPPAAPTVSGLASGPERPFRSGRGWTVTIQKPDGGKPFCQATRNPDGAADAGPRMVFRTAAAESGFVLSGVSHPATPGERYELTASFDQGAKLTLSGRGLPDGSLYVAIPSKTYLDELDPFARNRRVTFRSAALGDLGAMALTGTSWAINASDECRILNADP